MLVMLNIHKCLATFLQCLNAFQQFNTNIKLKRKKKDNEAGVNVLYQ